MRFRAAVSRILYPASGTAIICLCDQNPEFITPRATAHSLFGLAAGRVCHAMRLSPAPGGLLPRHFTLTTFPEKAWRYLSVALSFPWNIVHSILLFKRIPCSVQSGLSSNEYHCSGNRKQQPFNGDCPRPKTSRKVIYSKKRICQGKIRFFFKFLGSFQKSLSSTDISSSMNSTAFLTALARWLMEFFNSGAISPNV